MSKIKLLVLIFFIISCSSSNSNLNINENIRRENSVGALDNNNSKTQILKGPTLQFGHPIPLVNISISLLKDTISWGEYGTLIIKVCTLVAFFISRIISI